ncbi:hypothetical protein FPV67DRAFT_508362 [Lyophyllum atratum]|nr:hypothetical protein FPV67DRAFT_508362 [Lyophyllum atratum]
MTDPIYYRGTSRLIIGASCKATSPRASLRPCAVPTSTSRLPCRFLPVCLPLLGSSNKAKYPATNPSRVSEEPLLVHLTQLLSFHFFERLASIRARFNTMLSTPNLDFRSWSAPRSDLMVYILLGAALLAGSLGYRSKLGAVRVRILRASWMCQDGIMGIVAVFDRVFARGSVLVQVHLRIGEGSRVHVFWMPLTL